MTRPTTVGHVRSFRGARSLALFLTFACSFVFLSAQNVIFAPDPEPLQVSAQRKLAPPPPLSRPPPGPETPYQLGGVFVLHPRISYKHTRAEGLPIRGQTQRDESEISNFSMGLSLDMGERWTLDYSPSWVSYSNESLTDNVEHSARLSGELPWESWVFNFNQNFSKSNQTLIETAQQTDRESWSTQLGASFQFSPKVQFSVSGNMNESFSSLSSRQRSWSARGAINYLLTEQVRLSLNPTYSYTEVADAPDYSNEGLSGMINWQPVDKVALSAGVGLSSRHSTSSAGLDDTSPLLSFGLSYQPFATTGLNVAYSRNSSSSFFRAQTTENRSVSLGLSQRLLGRIYLRANYAKSTRNYQSLLSNVSVSREDDVESFSVRLSTRLLQRLSVGIFYQDSKNSSNQSTFSFSSTQYGIELGYRY